MAVKINGVEFERLGVTSNRENQTRTGQTFAGVWPSVKYAYNADGNCIGEVTAAGNVVSAWGGSHPPTWPGDSAVPVRDSCWTRGY